MLAGIGENAGVVDIGDGWAATFKVESHNHPSYVEPYQGAATGVGGIVRDIMAMGARPVAVMDQLRFGAADAPDTRRVVDGVVRGIGGYGNSLGPAQHRRRDGVRRLLCAAIRWSTRCASGCCARRICTWRSRRAPATRSSCSARAPASTVSAACPCWRRRRSAATRTAPGARSCRRSRSATRSWRRCSSSAASSCMPPAWWSASRISVVPDCPVPLRNSRRPVTAAWPVELDKVPLRAANMTPAEMLSSESQERMCAVVTPENVDAFMAVCRKWEVLATVIGEVTDGDRLSITWHGETVVDVPPRTVAHEGPVYERPVERPDTQDALNADTSDTAATADDRRRTARDSACAAWQSAPVQPGVHHRAVRPLRARKHRAGRECRRRRAAHRRGHRPRNRGVHRRLRPLHRNSTRTPARNWRSPRRTATSRSPAPPRSR